MTDSDVTIVVVPRERFSLTRRALEYLYERTSPPFALIYVDGGSNPTTRRYLKAQAAERGFQLIRTDHYLSPNEARNLGLRHVTSKYVVFIDNDVLVAPNWLPPLVRCAEETGAWVVGPVYCIGEPEADMIHMAGGVAHVTESQGRRSLVEQHRLVGKRLTAALSDLSREPVELVEFHCVLVRTEVFDRLGPLDEELKSSPEHIDLCLAVRSGGGGVYFEPASVVTYVPARSVQWSDLPFYLLRWSEEWNRSSLRHFAQKWRLAADDRFVRWHHSGLTTHRRYALHQFRSLSRRLIGWRYAARLERVIEAVLTCPLIPGIRLRRRRFGGRALSAPPAGG